MFFLLSSLGMSRGDEDFYASTNSLSYGTHKPTKEAVDKMTNDLEKQ
jgi:hypothetical protein